MKNIVNKNIEEWSKHPFCEQTQKEINNLKKDETKLYDAFYKKLISKVKLTDVSSSFAMEQIKYTTALPLPNRDAVKT